uniref:Uncharacterized protein n=1 Tax=Romanomermis culicivorax TaxID=13658 RepID=A0A915HGV9_ROMCU
MIGLNQILIAVALIFVILTPFITMGANVEGRSRMSVTDGRKSDTIAKTVAAAMEHHSIKKRSWQKTSGLWGKRASSYFDDQIDTPPRFYNDQNYKRGWEKTSGLWG